MQCRQRPLRAAERVGDLDQTARIGARVRLRAVARTYAAFRSPSAPAASAGSPRRCRPNRSGCPARRAPRPRGRGCGRRRARRQRQPLRMAQVARVLQRHGQLERVPRYPGRSLGEQLADVAHLGRERLGTLVRRAASRLPSDATRSPTCSRRRGRRRRRRRGDVARTPCPRRGALRGRTARHSSPAAAQRPRSRPLRAPAP